VEGQEGRSWTEEEEEGSAEEEEACVPGQVRKVGVEDMCWRPWRLRLCCACCACVCECCAGCADHVVPVTSGAVMSESALAVLRALVW